MPSHHNEKVSKYNYMLIYYYEKVSCNNYKASNWNRTEITFLLNCGGNGFPWGCAFLLSHSAVWQT